MALLFAACLAGCASGGPAPYNVGNIGGMPAKRVSEKNACYELQIDYPVLEHAEIDRQLRGWVENNYREITGELKAICARQTPEIPFRFWVEYEFFSTSRTASVVFKSMFYAAGGEEYQDSISALNYLWEGGLPIMGYNELFEDLTGLMPAISAQVRGTLGPKLKSIWREHPEYGQAVNSGELCLSSFAITENGLVLYFPTRRIAPFFAGPQRCSVGLAKLAQFIPKPGIWY